MYLLVDRLVSFSSGVSTLSESAVVEARDMPLSILLNNWLVMSSKFLSQFEFGRGLSQCGNPSITVAVGFCRCPSAGASLKLFPYIFLLSFMILTVT